MESIKRSLKELLRYQLRVLARLTLTRYRPSVVGVTGTVGKTSTKLAIASVLGVERRVRASKGNFNNELGLPLTILGEWEKVGGVFFWVRVIVASIFRLAVKHSYPEILILEYGIDAPGDMKYLLEIARPNVAVVTAIGEVPVHVEFFEGPQDVAREKARLVESLPSAGYAVLNADDGVVADMRARTRANVFTYGFKDERTVQVTSYEYRTEAKRPVGVSFKVEYGGSFVPVRLDGSFGRSQGYAAGAAACVGLIFGMNLVTISQGLERYHPPAHRLELVPGVKYTFLVDDTYNASPLSMEEAIRVLKGLPGMRKVAVLGDMLEIGKYAIEAHAEIGHIVSRVADVLVTVGPRAKFIAEGARERGMQKKAVMEFDTSEEAAKPVEKLLKRGDLVLVKGSRAMRMERIVEEIKAM